MFFNLSSTSTEVPTRQKELWEVTFTGDLPPFFENMFNAEYAEDTERGNITE